MGCVYRVRFASGKSYVGMTTRSAQQRLSNHLSAALRGGKLPVNRAFKKYAPGGFELEILVRSEDLEILRAEERRLILEIRTKVPYGYNLTDGGEGVCGYAYTPEQRAATSRAASKRVLSEETRKKIAASMTGKKFGPISEEKRRRLALAAKARKRGPPSAETRARI